MTTTLRLKNFCLSKEKPQKIFAIHVPIIYQYCPQINKKKKSQLKGKNSVQHFTKKAAQVAIPHGKRLSITDFQGNQNQKMSQHIFQNGDGSKSQAIQVLRRM